MLALGSLHDGGGSFEPGKGKAWELLSVALAKVPDLPKAKNSLVALQAITTVAVYCLGVTCISIEHRIMTEMARMAQDLAPSLCKSPYSKAFYRVFWVVYVIEKIMSFHFGRPSVGYLMMLLVLQLTFTGYHRRQYHCAYALHTRVSSRSPKLGAHTRPAEPSFVTSDEYPVLSRALP